MNPIPLYIGAVYCIILTLIDWSQAFSAASLILLCIALSVSFGRKP